MAMHNPPHPGKLIKVMIDNRDISRRELARKMGVSVVLVNDLIDGNANITGEIADKLQAGKYGSNRMWLSMQCAWYEWQQGLRMMK